MEDVAELGRLDERALADRASIGISERGEPVADLLAA
jgi:uncharacterized protein YjiS (DUF1127 family)